ncbi:DUF3099 domain-containing protein [Streptomyces sp. HSW2009]|uniref:DUF3099 domain-containing protein n=1 Tax=Streptomyces sp. HSW2009 TaxID=3142890 RepID=UPI0032EEBBDC
MYARRRRGYFLMMGACLTLFVLAWAVVRLWSIPVAVGMCVVAMVIPPLAAIVANRRGPDDHWFDEPGGTPPPEQRGGPDTRPGPHPGARPPSAPAPGPAPDTAPDLGRSSPDRRPAPGRKHAGTRGPGSRTGDAQSDAWWDELDGKHHR